MASRHELPRAESFQRDPSVDHRSRGADHRSEARLYKTSYGKESKLAYLGHALVENRNGLIAAAMATQADGHAERDAALLMLNQRQKNSSRRITMVPTRL